MTVVVAVVVAVIVAGKATDVVGALVVELEAAGGMTREKAGEKTGSSSPWRRAS